MLWIVTGCPSDTRRLPRLAAETIPECRYRSAFGLHRHKRFGHAEPAFRIYCRIWKSFHHFAAIEQMLIGRCLLEPKRLKNSINPSWNRRGSKTMTPGRQV